MLKEFLVEDSVVLGCDAASVFEVSKKYNGWTLKGLY